MVVIKIKAAGSSGFTWNFGH